MREFFGSLKFKIFVVVACVLIGLMLRTAATGGLSTATQSVVSVVLAPFESASSYLTDAFTGLINNIANLGSLSKENQQLKSQIVQLKKQIVDYNEMKDENTQLKGLFNITQENDSRKYTTARVISRDPNQWFSSFTIDKGTLDGIEKDDPVITDAGLVGIVETPGPTSSVVTTILDPSVHVGGLVSQTGDIGSTHGTRELSLKGQFELDYLPKNTSVTAGNIIVTTGAGGIYPKNLQVGTVKELVPDISGSTVDAICEPMVDPSSVEDVFVIVDFSGKDVSATAGGK